MFAIKVFTADPNEKSETRPINTVLHRVTNPQTGEIFHSTYLYLDTLKDIKPNHVSKFSGYDSDVEYVIEKVTITEDFNDFTMPNSTWPGRARVIEVVASCRVKPGVISKPTKSWFKRFNDWMCKPYTIMTGWSYLIFILAFSFLSGIAQSVLKVLDRTYEWNLF